MILWSFDELVGMNEGYEVGENAPGLLLFGTDARERRGMGIVKIPFVPMDWERALPCGRTFTDFLNDLRRPGGCFSPGDGADGVPAGAV